MRALALTLVVGTACGAEPTIDTYVELRFIEGVSEVPGDEGWHAGAVGHVGVAPWARNGPSPDAGDCVAWLRTADPGQLTLPPSDLMLEIDDVGSFRILEYPDGDLEVARDALPPSPFLEANRGVSLRLDADRAVRSTAPHALELTSPPSGATISLHDPIAIDWTAGGERRIAITLSLFSALVFRGAVNCISEDADHFEILDPASLFPDGYSLSDVELANLYVASERNATDALENVQLQLRVRQQVLRPLAVSK